MNVMRTLLLLTVVGPLAFAACGGDTSRTATTATAPGTTTSEPATVPAPPSATTAAATSTSAPPPDVIDGLRVQELRLADPVPLPNDLVVYYAIAGYAKDIDRAQLLRVYRAGSGQVRFENLLASLESLGNVYSATLDPDHGWAAATVSTRGFCGGYGMPKPDARCELFTSSDGGVSWTDGGRVPSGTFIAWIDAAGPVVIQGGFDGVTPVHYSRFPSGQLVSVPDGSTVFVHGAGLFTVQESGDQGAIRYVGLDGSEAFASSRRPGAQTTARPIASAIGQRFPFTSWVGELLTGEPSNLNVYLETSTGSVVYRWTGRDLRPIEQIRQQLILANVFIPDAVFGTFPAAIIDLDARTIRPIADLQRTTGGDAYPQTATVGPVARVASGGECLNVRTGPSIAAGSLGCYRDGVLLARLPLPNDAANDPGWVPVRTPDGRSGWANAAYLDR